MKINKMNTYSTGNIYFIEWVEKIPFLENSTEKIEKATVLDEIVLNLWTFIYWPLFELKKSIAKNAGFMETS